MRFLILMTMVSIASVLGAQTPGSAPSASAPAGNAQNGKKIYVSYGCYQCHNYEAQGGGAGPRLAPRPIGFQALSRYVRRPTDQMPPYTTKVLSDQELADIYAFLLSVAQPPSATSIPILNRK